MITEGSVVIYVDSRGREKDALITAVHGDPDQQPPVNLVHVTLDPDRTDSYGRQIERESSIVHQVNQGAHGNYWREVK